MLNQLRLLKTGDPAPPLDLPTAKGDRVRLEDLRGRSVLLSFLSHAA
jgi:peroxiredoxin